MRQVRVVLERWFPHMMRTETLTPVWSGRKVQIESGYDTINIDIQYVAAR